MDSAERIVVPLLIVQTISVVFLWSLDTLGHVSQIIFTLFLAADLLSFGLMSHRVHRSGHDHSGLVARNHGLLRGRIHRLLKRRTAPVGGRTDDKLMSESSEYAMIPEQ